MTLFLIISIALDTIATIFEIVQRRRQHREYMKELREDYLRKEARADRLAALAARRGLPGGQP